MRTSAPTRDPELRAIPSGTSVCSLRIACNSAQRDATGEFTERPNYFDVTVFGARGESVANYMRKGGRVAVDGRLDWREWETGDQQKRQAVSIVADTVQFLDPPKDRSETDDQLDGDGSEDREPVGVGAADGDDLVF
ncbi:MAG TPA: single-stranded DNA-binding protein [Solirubrobacteraceae bacterium]|nr:single-stranded DNA-binding protein [Solirubrobacteraceae bacterium]